MKSYLLNGKKAQGEDYLTALESLSDEDDLCIGIPGERGLIVSVCSEGFFVSEERLDGSTHLTAGLSKERVRTLIDRFLSEAEDWREGLNWELTALPSKYAARRALVLLLIGGVVVGLVWWLTEHTFR